MVNQAVHLREESQDDRRITTARELVVAVTDEDSRNTLNAGIARSLIDNLARSNANPSPPDAPPAQA